MKIRIPDFFANVEKFHIISNNPMKNCILGRLELLRFSYRRLVSRGVAGRGCERLVHVAVVPSVTCVQISKIVEIAQ